MAIARARPSVSSKQRDPGTVYLIEDFYLQLNTLARSEQLRAPS